MCVFLKDATLTPLLHDDMMTYMDVTCDDTTWIEKDYYRMSLLMVVPDNCVPC